MEYIKNNLMDGEEIVYNTKIHWFTFIPGLVLLVISLFVLLLYISTDSGNAKVLLFPFSPILFICSFFSLLNAFIIKKTTELAITSKRTITKFGLIARNTTEVNHNQVESFNVNQGIFGRMFDFGTLIINGTGSGSIIIKNIDQPLEFRKKAITLIDEVRDK